MSTHGLIKRPGLVLRAGTRHVLDKTDLNALVHGAVRLGRETHVAVVTDNQLVENVSTI
jgi:hypothetical protein